MILTPTNSPRDWRALLADPQKHWRKGYSAMSLAYCWEEAKGFPTAVKKALASCQALKDLQLILAIPEHKVSLPGGRAASQNDLFVLGRTPEGLVEGKFSEPFGPLVSEWYVDPSPGKTKMMSFELRLLNDNACFSHADNKTTGSISGTIAQCTQTL